MGPLSAISSFFILPARAVHHSINPVSLSSRVWLVASLILMGFGTAAAPLHRRYDGGVVIPQPDFSSLKPLVPEYGPFYSPEFSCLAHKMDLTTVQNIGLNNLFPEDFLTHSKVCAVNPYFNEVFKEIPHKIRPYVDAVKELVPVYSSVKVHFPDNLSAFMYNELGLIDNGNKACLLTGHPEYYALCQKTSESIQEIIISEKSMQEVMAREVFNEDIYRNKGFMIGLPENGEVLKKISLGMNPEAHTNYKAALKFLEEQVLADDCFFQKKPDEIVSFIKKLHAILLNNLPANDPIDDVHMAPGVYRKERMLVLRRESNMNAYIEDLEKQGATAEEVGIFKNSLVKTQLGEKFYDSLTPLEMQLWRKVVYITPSVDEIEKLMDDFSVEFKQYANQEIHPVALAAWVHCEIGKIHPFGDGNGRLSRLLLNTILVRGGYDPVIFLDDDEYTKAIIKNDAVPGAFASYLAGVIRKQTRGVQLLFKGDHTHLRETAWLHNWQDLWDQAASLLFAGRTKSSP